jgi:glutamine amidotransferase
MSAAPMVTLIDYRMGNLRSIGNALRHVGAEVRVVDSADGLKGAGHVVLPGVGAFGASMRNLAERGLDDALRTHAAQGRPLLGICLGFQVLFDRGTEGGEHRGLGLIGGAVRRFETSLHIPHTGWNELRVVRPHPLLDGISDGEHVYFVHSYHPDAVDPSDVICTSEYDGAFVCGVARGSVVGTQFHPEKSGPAGLKLLSNFLAWSPRA